MTSLSGVSRNWGVPPAKIIQKPNGWHIENASLWPNNNNNNIIIFIFFYPRYLFPKEVYYYYYYYLFIYLIRQMVAYSKIYNKHKCGG